MRRLIATAVLVSSLLLAAASTAGFATQSPPETEGCGKTGPKIERGRTGLALGETALTVTMPATGSYISLPALNEAPGPALFICHIESGSSIIIDARTGLEISRSLGDPSGGPLLDEIAANARVDEVARPTPAPGNAQEMTPPRTGSGGLKAQ